MDIPRREFSKARPLTAIEAGELAEQALARARAALRPRPPVPAAQHSDRQPAQNAAPRTGPWTWNSAWETGPVPECAVIAVIATVAVAGWLCHLA